jgi:plasmid stabilization system protein ParE
MHRYEWTRDAEERLERVSGLFGIRIDPRRALRLRSLLTENAHPIKR